MLECGSLVPMIANWPKFVPAGKVTNQLIDASDFFPTLAEITGAKLPENKIMDGVSFAPQLLGKKGKERTWIFTELGNKWYVRDDKYKLNREGELFDMSNAPFEEKIISPDTKDAAAIEARNRLQKILENLNPAGGFVDDGNGSGRHAKKDKKTE
jgi:arylsulfatase A